MAGVKIGLNKLTVAGIHIRTSEHLFQVCRYPDRPDVQQLILDDASPKGAKMVAKKYRTDCRNDWDVVHLDIMRWAIRVKLAFNYNQLGAALLLSGLRDIVELAPNHSTSGRYWGAISRGQTLVGANVMGQLLMELRNEFRKKSRDAMLVVTLPTVSNFKLLGQFVSASEAPQLPLAA